MAYQRGAFLTTNVKPLAFVPGKYDFTEFAALELAELDAIGADLDNLLPDLVAMAADTTDPLDGFDVNVAGVELGNQAQTAILSDLSDMVGTILEVDGAFDGAVRGAPAEAWTDPPNKFVPPQGAPFLDTPTIPAQDFTGIQNAVVGQTGSTSGQLGRALTLINATVYGSSNFRITDTWLIQATGQAGEFVVVQAYVNGAYIGSEPIGQIGSDGRFEKGGAFSSDDAGAWREVWTIGGVGVATYSFIVSPS